MPIEQLPNRFPCRRSPHEHILFTLRCRKVIVCLIAALFVITPSAFSQSPAASTEDEFAVAMDQVASPLYKADAPGAAIVVVKNGQVIFRKGYGVANMELSVPISPGMVFRLASVTKQFTAVAIMMLVEQGKLSLHDDITKFFPDYPALGKKIKVENLLTHTSGIKDYLEDVSSDVIHRDLPLARLINLFKNKPLGFDPGTKDAYSNSNYILLGAIIEKLSGKTYRQFIEQNIFKHLAMTHSFYGDIQRLIPNRASASLKYEGAYINEPYMSPTVLFSAGELYSCVDDLALWDAAVYSNELIRHSSWERLFTPYKFPNGETSVFAFGWTIGHLQGRRMESHGGGLPGSRVWVLRLPEDHVYVAILSNNSTEGTQPEIVANTLAAIAIGRPITDAKVIKLEPEVLDRYVGQYQSSAGDIFTIRRQGDKLMAESTDNPEVELFPISEDKFSIKAFDAKVSFVRDAQGKLTGFTADFMGRNTNYKKIR